MISARNLGKKFGRLTALSHVSLDFRAGTSYALVGPNGSGKSTLIKCILGMVIPSSGNIEVDGENIRGQWKYRRKLGYMPQIGRYPDNMRIGQIFDMMRSIRGNPEKVDTELPEVFGLLKMLDKRMHTLSGGTRQKVSAALAFLFNPPVITSHIMSDLDELAGHVLYLQDGQLCYDNSIDTLKKVTGEDRLGKAMVKMINGLREGNAQGD